MLASKHMTPNEFLELLTAVHKFGDDSWSTRLHAVLGAAESSSSETALAVSLPRMAISMNKAGMPHALWKSSVVEVFGNVEKLEIGVRIFTTALQVLASGEENILLQLASEERAILRSELKVVGLLRE